MYDIDIQIRHHVLWIFTIMSILFQHNKMPVFINILILLYIAFVLEENLYYHGVKSSNNCLTFNIILYIDLCIKMHR